MRCSLLCGQESVGEVRFDAGSSLIEMLLALALTGVVTTGALALVTPVQGVFQAQPEAMDMHQRLRAAVDALARDLTIAGAGPYVDASAGSLIGAFAPVIPRRIGLVGADSVTAVRPDAITLSYVPTTFAQTTTSAPFPQAAGLSINTSVYCPWGTTLCGFEAGMTAAVFDKTAHFDVFTISSIQSGSLQVLLHNPTATYSYPTGARVSRIESHSYYFDAANRQLRQSDGYQTDVPVADNVVGLSFEYFGDPNPPTEPRPPAGVENCLYDLAGNPTPMATLTGPNEGFVPLPLSIFSDGPWCGSGGTQFDADLFRVRAVRVTLRIQTGLAAFRVSGPAFLKSGTSRASDRYLPDLAATFMITPRNLRASR
jgi:hypothetical protein